MHKATYHWWQWPVIILAGLLIYGQTFHFGFVFDDICFITTNPYIQHPGHLHSPWYPYPLTRSLGFCTFALNYFFNRLDPSGYHIFNFLVHLTATGLVWALAELLFKITGRSPAKDPMAGYLPFLIALIFLVHPCQTQAISYISQRFESMATVFYLATIYCYLKARTATERERQIAFFILCGLFTLLGVLTKEVVITTPGMIIASEWILFPRKNDAGIYIKLVITGFLLYLLFTKLVHSGLEVFGHTLPSQSHDGEILTPQHYFLTQMRVFLTFLRLLVFPYHQNLDYDYPASTGLLAPPLTLAGLSAIILMIAVVIKLRQQLPLVSFGLAWTLITFAINLAPRENVIFEHKLYLISFGFFLAAVGGLSVLVQDQKLLTKILICVIAALSVVSFERNKVWKDTLTLWNDVVQKSPRKARAWNNRGLEFLNRGELLQAEADFSKVIELDPGYLNAYVNRGFTFEKEGRFAQAIMDDNRSIQIDPKSTAGYVNLGNIYLKMNELPQALSNYDKALKLDPQLAEAYNDRGNTYLKLNNLTQAASDYQKAIALKPDYADTYFNLAFIYTREGQWQEAVDNYSKDLELNPEDTQAYNNRAMIYARTGITSSRQ